jgi:hypothetical protein
VAVATTKAIRGQPVDHVLAVELDGNLNLYDAVTDSVHVLNSTASDIWRLLDSERSLDEIAQILADAYSAPAADIKGHIANTISTFAERGLLVDHDGSYVL